MIPRDDRAEREPVVCSQSDAADAADAGHRPRGKCYLDLVKRLLFALAIGYVVLALVSRAKEAAGLLTCSCYPDCWCQKPGLSLFRWVFPRFHHNPEIEAWKQRQLDLSA